MITAPLHAEDYTTRYDEETHLKNDTELSGTVYIKETLHVPKGITLIVAPGTVIRCEHPDFCDDGNVNFSIEVEGNIIAQGTPENPITFTSASDKYAYASGFGEIYITESEYAVFDNVKFLYSHWGLHVHDSNVTVMNCEFKDVFGGIRFKGDKLIIKNSSFINNDTSLRFWQSAPEVTGNTFTNVKTALFIREKVVGPAIKRNDFSGVTDYCIKLGELQDMDITIHENNFGEISDDAIADKIFDHADEDYIGKVIIK